MERELTRPLVRRSTDAISSTVSAQKSDSTERIGPLSIAYRTTRRSSGFIVGRVPLAFRPILNSRSRL